MPPVSKPISSWWTIQDMGYKTPCWMWIGGLNNDGYGNVRRGAKIHKAYRYVYELFKGTVPKGMQLDHLCRNRACVNPEHLEIVSCAVNNQRGKLAKLTPEVVQEIRSKKGTCTYEALGKMYGISKAQAHKIANKTSWKGD